MRSMYSRTSVSMSVNLRRPGEQEWKRCGRSARYQLTRSKSRTGAGRAGGTRWTRSDRWRPPALPLLLAGLPRSNVLGSTPDSESFVDDVRDRLLAAGYLGRCGALDEEGGQGHGGVLAEEARRADLPVVDDAGQTVMAGHRVQLED